MENRIPTLGDTSYTLILSRESWSGSYAGPIEYWGWNGSPKRYYETIADRKRLSYMMAVYSDPPERKIPNKQKLRSIIKKTKK